MEAVKVVVQDMDIVGSGLEWVLGQGHDQGPGWEFDQDTLQVPGQEFAQEYDLDMELGRCRVGQDSLGYDQVSPLHHHQVSGCTVSDTPLK